jgi:hypothetical protein
MVALSNAAGSRLASSMDRGGTDIAFPSRDNRALRFPLALQIGIDQFNSSEKAAANARPCQPAIYAMLLKKPPVSRNRS